MCGNYRSRGCEGIAGSIAFTLYRFLSLSSCLVIIVIISITATCDSDKPPSALIIDTCDCSSAYSSFSLSSSLCNLRYWAAASSNSLPQPCKLNLKVSQTLDVSGKMVVLDRLLRELHSDEGTNIQPVHDHAGHY